MMMWSSKMRQQCWHHAAYPEVSPELYQSTSLLPGRFVENGFFGCGRGPFARRTKQHRYDRDQVSHAFRFSGARHLLLGFSSGAVIAVALFDMLPEVVALDGGAVHFPLGALGFLAFFGLERYAALHRTAGHAHARNEQKLGIFSAGGLCVHSFLDGVAISAGFQTSTKLGLLIAIGIIAHDVSDGLNTVTVVIAHGNSQRKAWALLVIDMLAPVLGATTTLFITLDGLVAPVLAFFAGSFLYIGASDLLPEAKLSDSPKVGLATAAGMLAIFAATRSMR
jgi:zinc transporter ZupT